MVVLKFALIALVLVLLGPLSVVPADAEPRLRCLTRDQQRTRDYGAPRGPAGDRAANGARPGARGDWCGHGSARSPNA